MHKPFYYSFLHFFAIVLFVQFLAINSATAQLPNEKDLAFKEKQDALFSRKLETYFDTIPPQYHSLERRNTLYLADAIMHHPFPHNNSLKNLFLYRYKKTLANIKETKIDTGVVLWNIYNIAYIIKTAEITVAFDLIQLPSSLRIDGEEDMYKNLAEEIVELCDLLFVSHKHGDHADSFVAKQFLAQNKPVLTHLDVFKEESFYNQITHLPRNGKKILYKLPETNIEIVIRTFPGHQAQSENTFVTNNFTVITLPNVITIAHSGDQSWAADFEWIDTIYKDVDIDILLVNTWTLWPDRLIEGLKPKVILPSHINEMNHEISSRIPYWQSYQNWKNTEEKTIHLFWGEQYNYNKPLF